MRTAAFAGTAVALALVAPAAARAETVTIGMPARTFLPPQLDVVTGDTVRWANTSSEAHDLSAADASFSSAPIPPGGEFSQAFADPGTHPYVCVLHRVEMQGELRVVPVTLSGPPTPATDGEPVELTGRAPAGTTLVTVEAAPSAQGPFVPVATAAPSSDGRFRVAPRVSGPTTYRAAVAAGTSPPVPLTVVDRVKVRVTVVRGPRLTTLRVRTTPARPGARAVLELYSRERFAWRRVGSGTLDGEGAMELTLAASVRRLARVRLLRPDGSVAARSAAVATWPMRAAAKPPAAPHHEHVRPRPSPPGASPRRRAAARARPGA